MTRKCIFHRLAFMMTVFVFIFGISACGQKGPLVHKATVDGQDIEKQRPPEKRYNNAQAKGENAPESNEQ